MASSFTEDEIAAIAALANVELEPGEVELFSRQFREFLAYAEAVLQVDTTGIPPTANIVASPAAGRADEARPSLPIEDTLANAPEADRTLLEGGFFKVPRVLG